MINFDMIKLALEYHEKGNDNLAQNLIFVAVKDVQEDSVPSVTTEGKSVLYGEGGKYTDSADPRKPNANHHEGGNGTRVSAVNALVRTKPNAKYGCVSVETLLNDESCNVYVTVLNKNGAMVPPNDVYMLTGSTDGVNYQNRYDAGNGNGSFFMGRDSKFFGHDVGPIGVAVCTVDGSINSDFVFGLGLKEGQHMSYRVVFQER